MSKLTLAKNSTVLKLPRQSNSVKSTFEKALRRSKEQRWTHVVILGYGDEGGHAFNSKMDTHHVIGMLEDLKYLITRDNYR